MELQKLGFVVEPSTEASDSITKDYVISTNPVAGENLPAGSTVYIVVSGGPEITPISMPNLVGLTQSQAVSKLESCNLTFGGVSPVESDLPEGTIIWQSVSAYSEVEEHTKVYLQVSIGPKETPSPTPSETVEPTQTAEVSTPPVTTAPSTDVTPPPSTEPVEPSVPVAGGEE